MRSLESIGDKLLPASEPLRRLTLAALEAWAVPLREQYSVVRFVRLEDGFALLPVGPEGPMGVGAAQYVA